MNKRISSTCPSQTEDPVDLGIPKEWSRNLQIIASDGTAEMGGQRFYVVTLGSAVSVPSSARRTPYTP